MRPARAAACILFVALFVGLAVLFSVLQRPSPSGPNAPIPGKIRILAQKVTEDKNTIHWRWTIIGDRSWVTFSSKSGGTEEEIALQTEPSIFSRVVGPEGSGSFVYELKVGKGGTSSPGQTSYTADITLKGSKREPNYSSSVGSAAAYSSMGELVTILTPKDTVIPLPARVSLAILDGKTLTLQFSK